MAVGLTCKKGIGDALLLLKLGIIVYLKIVLISCNNHCSYLTDLQTISNYQ